MYIQKAKCELISGLFQPAVWLAGLHVVMIEVPQPSQLITSKEEKNIYSFTKFPTILQQDGRQYRGKIWDRQKKPNHTSHHSTSPSPDSSTYFPIKIFRSGPFPRKSSGACLFLVGLLGLSSTVLLKRKTSGTTCYFGMLSRILCCCKNCLNPKSIKMIIWNGYFKTLHCCTSLSQSSDILRFSRHSSSPLCWGCAVRDNEHL